MISAALVQIKATTGREATTRQLPNRKWFYSACSLLIPPLVLFRCYWHEIVPVPLSAPPGSPQCGGESRSWSEPYMYTCQNQTQWGWHDDLKSFSGTCDQRPSSAWSCCHPWTEHSSFTLAEMRVWRGLTNCHQAWLLVISMQTLPDVNTFGKKKDEKYLFSNLEVRVTQTTLSETVKSMKILP